jgi:hypothetical protein
MDDQTKAAFAGVSDVAKQLITLATGVLVLEITFAKNIQDSSLDRAAKHLLAGSWLLFLLSVVAGVWTLLALTGCLGQDEPVTARTIYGSNVRLPAVLQISLFLVGLGLTIWFGIHALR